MLLAVEEALGRLAPGELSWLRGRTSVDSKKQGCSWGPMSRERTGLTKKGSV